MTRMTSTISKLAAGAALATVLALSTATPSLAFNSNDGGPFMIPSGGPAWSYGADAYAYAPAPYAYGPSAYYARGQARGYRGRYDDPPGSRYQSRGESRDDMGCPC